MAEGGGSTNTAEAEAIAVHLAELLLTQKYAGSVGVIAPFNAQVALLQKLISERLTPDLYEKADLRIATADRFQGQERDLILFSPTVCQGSLPSGQIFLQRDWRRINVAISRARAVAHVFGDLNFARTGGIQVLR